MLYKYISHRSLLYCDVDQRHLHSFPTRRSSDLFLSLMLGSVLVLMLPLLVRLTPDLRIKKSLLKCNWTIRKRLPRCKMRLKKRLLAFSRSEERFSRNAETDIVCRLLLEKKKKKK